MSLRRHALLIGLFTTGLIVAVVVMVAVWMASGGKIVIRIPEADIQKALDDPFPVEKKHLLILRVRYSNPVVMLEEGTDRIHAGLDAQTLFLINDKSYSGTARVSGELQYNPDTGEFHLANSKVENLGIAGVSNKYQGLVNDIATGLLKGRLDNHPVYRLKPTDTKKALALLVLEKVEVKEGHVVVTLGMKEHD